MKSPLKKNEVLAVLAEKQDLTKVQVRNFFEGLRDLIYAEVKTSGQFTLPDIGKFSLKERKARIGRNPATGESIKIPKKTVLKFRIGKPMKDNCLPAKK